MANLSWGKPRIFVKDIDTPAAKWKELNTPVQDTTELQPSKGDKLEAPIEGGQNEEVKYKDSSYAVVYNIRKKKGRSVPLPNTNGVCGKHYAFALIPEDPTNVGFYIESTTATVDDTFTPADGAIWAMQHDAIAAAAGNTVKWGTFSIEGVGEDAKLNFTETQPAEGVEAKTFKEGVTLL